MGDLYGEYKIYDLNGNIAGSSDGANIDGLKVPKGYTVYITSKKDAAECVVLNEYFIIKKVSNPENVEYLDIAYGKTYKITNNSASYYYFLNNNCDFTMDIVAYYSDDKTCPVGNTTQNAFSISGGGYVYVRFYVNTSIYNSPTLTIEEMDTPILEKVELTPGKIYSFENLNNKYSPA